MAKVLDANQLAEELKQKIKADIGAGQKLTLASLRINNGDYSSEVYSAQQEKIAGDISSGIDYRLISLDSATTLEPVLKKISELNLDKTITGILFNKPFCQSWKEEEIFSAIDPAKDVEGMNPCNFGRLALSNPVFIPPIALSVLALIKSTKLELPGKRVTIVSSSNIIGKPLALLLADKFATVSITHIATSEAGDLEFYVKDADILISAAGVPGLIKGDWIKKGAVVIDVGTAKKGDKISGDVEFDKAKEKALAITPVPGGVGKLTTMFLFHNLLIAHKKQKR